MKKKLFAAISLGILSTFVSGALTASAAELIVNGGPNNMTAEQKAEWVGEIQGGYGIAHNISMNNNRLELNGGDYSNYQIKGGYAAEGDANNNIVDISGEVENTSNLIYGGYTENGEANGNKVSFDGVKFTENYLEVYGGYSKLGDVSGNTIEIDNSVKNKSDYGNIIMMTAGETVEGNSVGNRIFITNTVVENNGIEDSDNGFWGGSSEKGDVIGNSVIVDKSDLSDYLVGGIAINGNVLNNSVTISNSEIEAGFIRGGDVVIGNGKAENNRVFIDNSKLVNTKVIGGNGKSSDNNSHVGEIVSNIVRISNSTISGEIAGGKGENSTSISYNVVQIIDSNNYEDESGEHRCAIDVYGGISETNSHSIVRGNIVQIVDSDITLGIVYNDVDDNTFYGGRGKGTVKENIVSVENSTVEGRLVGGRSDGGAAEQNVVNINRGTVKGHIWGGLADNGIAKNNVVNISNSNVELMVSKKNITSLAGGVSSKEAVGNEVVITGSKFIGSGGKSPDIVGGLVKGVGKADDNYVAVVDSTVVGNIYGGLSMVIPDPDVDDEETVTATKGSANNNTIYIENSKIEGTIVAGAVVADNKVTSEANNNTIIISGEKTNIASAALVGAKKGTGNTLILDGWSGSAVSVAGFDNYSFQNIKDVENAVLTVNSASNIGTNTKFDVSFAGSVDLQEGQSVKLISVNDSIDVNNENINTSVGTSLDVVGSLVGVDKGVDFKVEKITLNRQTDIVGTANAAAASFVADGAQLAVDGMEQLNRDEYGFNTFASAYGSNGDYDNGVDMKGWNTMVGVGHNSETESGAFAWGVFYETGSGEMKAENSYRKAAFGVDGKAVYNGYGAAARLSKDNGVYYEAGLRAGKLKNNLSNALMNAALATEGYKTESDYRGYHVGVGKAVALDNGDQLDVYARYYHTQVDRDCFVASGGERYYLDKVYSDRIRVGGRYSDELNEAVKVYYGAAYEYEFSGEAEGSVKGYALNKSDLGGSSFVGELGLLMNNPGSAWTVDMSLQTYAGQYEGIGGKVQATYHF